MRTARGCLLSSHTADHTVGAHGTFDAIVVGLGAAGSATAYHLAHAGARVLGLDRFAPPHPLGSSHGESRIVRRAYFEGHQYLPLLERAWQLWRSLETAVECQLVTRCGSLNIGRPHRPIVAAAKESAVRLDLPHEVITPDDVGRRFPGFRVPADCVALLDVDAGLISPEEAVRAHLRQAARRGADLRFDEPVVRWIPEGNGVSVSTAATTYQAHRLVLTPGGWTPDLLGDLRLPIELERVTNAWFRPRRNASHFEPTRCPVFMWEYADDHIIYGMPDVGRGVKVGLHEGDTQIAHPDHVDRTVSDADTDRIRGFVRRLLPDAEGTVTHTAACFYTNTPDRHYLIDRHPQHSQVTYATCCSGHGFKASPAVGEALADLALDRQPCVDIGPFRFRW